MNVRARRLLLLPAAALLLLGAPALAVDGSPAPPPESVDIPLALPDGAAPGIPAQAETNAPADLVGVKWNGDPEAEFSVEVRHGEGDWEPAATLGGDDVVADEGSADARAALEARDGANVSDPVWVDGASDVRITVVSGAVDDVTVAAVTADGPTAPGGSAGALGLSLPASPDRFGFALALVLTGLVLGALALGWSPWRSRRHLAVAGVVAMFALTACVPEPPASPVSSQNPGSGFPPQPSITMRSSWGGDLAWNPSPDCAPGPEIASDLQFLVVHHTVNSNTYGPGDSRAMVRAIWSYHRNTLGYCDIAYNFIIDRYGQIFEGRQGGITKPVVAAHTGGFNQKSSGVALLGDLTSVQPPVEAWNALVDLIAWKLSIHLRNPADGFYAESGGAGARWPAGTVVGFPNRIVGHTDLWPTACPGNAFYPRLQELRDAVQPKVGWPSLTPTTTTTAPSTGTTAGATAAGTAEPPSGSTVPTTTFSTLPTTTVPPTTG